MIDPTDDMADAFRRVEVAYWNAQDHTAVGVTVAEHGRAAYRAGLAAVFELVERDYRVVARCDDTDCERPVRHGGMHGRCVDGREWVTWW